MNRRRLSAAALGVLVFTFPAAAQGARITGNVQPNTTVVAIAKDGRSWSALAGSRGSFSIAVKASRVTIQLRDPRGRYAGPVVVGGTKTKAVLGVRGAAKLGKLKLRNGAAFPAKPLASKFVDRKVSAKAVKGVPVGAGKLGFGGTLVGKASSNVPRTAQSDGPTPTPNPGPGPSPSPDPSPEGLTQPGADPDADGVPNTVDVDDNGNKIVDAVDASLSSRDPGGATSFTQMFLGLENTTNIDADPGSQAAIQTRMKEKLSLVLLNVPANTKLDCGGLNWCSPGGTGRMEINGPNGSTAGDPFPKGNDATMPLDGAGEFRILPGGGPQDVRAGDTLIQKRSDGSEQTVSLGFVFATIPAIKSWSTGAGAGGQVAYPAAEGATGTTRNPAPVAPGADGRRTLTIEFWRPQRASIPGAEPNGFIDIGHLVYRANVPQSAGPGPNPDPVRQAPECPVSTLTPGPGLDRTSGPTQLGGLTDSSDDQPSNSSRTLSFTVDLDACAAAKGTSFAPGQIIPFDLGAYAPRQTSVDHANQKFFIRID